MEKEEHFDQELQLKGLIQKSNRQIITYEDIIQAFQRAPEVYGDIFEIEPKVSHVNRSLVGTHNILKNKQRNLTPKKKKRK